ncbi:MAG: DNA-3-methyladenine glycosylase 2 family protein [Actinobacteria bacterium]|nr:DNA-3-methyladenine glycosylase 2 family protein [Actinomycetota bacterium]
MRRRLTLSEPVHLERLLAPLRMGTDDPTIRLSPHEGWRAFHTPVGPVTLHLRLDGETLTAEAWGDGREWALEHAPALAGADDDPAAFSPIDARIVRLWRRVGGVRLSRSGLVIDVLVQTILSQKVTGLEAKRAWNRLVWRRGRPAPGPLEPLRLPPTSQQIAAMRYEEWHPLGVERRRAETIRRACARIDRLQEAATMDRENAERRLTALPGMGPWTSALIRRIAFGDPDGVEVHDFHIPNLVAWNLAGEPRASDERMLELLEPWRGQRGRVIRLLELAGQAAPRYGPRMRVRRVEQL